MTHAEQLLQALTGQLAWRLHHSLACVMLLCKVLDIAGEQYCSWLWVSSNYMP